MGIAVNKGSALRELTLEGRLTANYDDGGCDKHFEEK